jgi:gliding motility-associated-like protein
MWSQLTGGARTITGNNVDLNGATAGAYTFQYTVTGTSPCPNATAIVTVNVVATANAGLANTVSACNNTAAFNLFTSLLGTPDVGGAWTQLTGGARTITGNDVDLDGATAGTYTFQYTVTGTNPCPDASAIVTVNVTAASNAGLANTVSSCNNTAAFNLFASLLGTPDVGGMWSQLTGGARTITGNNVDLNGATAGAYTFQYTVTGSSPCPNATAVVTVNVEATPNSALILSATIDPLCSGGVSEVSVANSEVGVSYQLRNNTDNSPVGLAVAGTGSTINLSTGALTATTTFNVLATNGTCPSIQMLGTVTITVAGNINASLTISAQDNTVCAGSSTVIQIANSEMGVDYQLRDDSDDSLIGAAIAGTGATINLPTGNLSSAKVFNVLASNAACFIELTTTPAVNVDVNPNPSLTVGATFSPVCIGGISSVTVDNSEVGVSYQLRDNVDNSLVGAAVAGTGGQIEFSTGVLAASKTYNVLATGGVCAPVQLNATVTVTVAGSINLSLTVTPITSSVCSGTGTDIQIFNSEVGVDYRLLNAADNSFLSGLVAGTGGTLSIPTGALTTDSDIRVLVANGSCTAELTTTTTISVSPLPVTSLAVNAVTSTLCSGISTMVQVVNSQAGVTYQLRDDADDSIVSGAVIGNGSTIDLPTGPLASTKTFNVIAVNGSCSAELDNRVSVTVNQGPLATISAVAQNDLVCIGTSTFVQVVNSEIGIIYQLRDNLDNSNVSGAAFGNGGTINLPTGPIIANRTFNVLASNALCSTQLATIVTVSVRAITDPLCSNCSTVIVSTINPVKVTCGATVPDGSITFQIEPAVPVVNIIGVKIEINGPTPKTQTNDFVFTGLAVGNYTYTVTYGDENNPDCIKSGTFIIELSREPDPITFDLTVDEYDCLVNEGSVTLENVAGAPDTDFEFTILSNGASVTQGVISKTSTASFTIPDLLLGDYEIKLSQNQQPVNGCVGIVDSQLIEFVIAEPLGGCPVIIPNIFTPNGDGSNDFFEIRNLPASTSLSITNRWGKEVFSSSDYQNNWTAENISDGVYYYRLVADGEVMTGWVEILR